MEGHKRLSRLFSDNLPATLLKNSFTKIVLNIVLKIAEAGYNYVIYAPKIERNSYTTKAHFSIFPTTKNNIQHKIELGGNIFRA